jgi:hypothetical protein
MRGSVLGGELRRNTKRMSPQRPTPLAALLSQHASPGQLLPSGMRQLGGSRPRKQAGDAGDGAWRRPACPRPLMTGW